MEKNKTWQRLYELASQFYRLNPWDYLLESDVFGVELPGTDRQYFISIMGSEGIIKSLAAYEGSVALAEFWSLENSENANGSDLLSIPHMILSFENVEDIDAGQLARFRKLSNDPAFTYLFPEFRRVIPGKYPNEPDADMQTVMITLLEQALDVISRTIENPDLIYPYEYDEKTYLIRKQSENNEWKDHYLSIDPTPVQYQFTWDNKDIDEINTLPVTHAVMQAHSQLLPLFVKEKDLTYFSYLIILVNKKSGNIENAYYFIADPDFHSMVQKVPAKFLEFIKSLGFRPRAVEVMNDLHYKMLSEPMRKCGIKLTKYKELPAVSEAIDGIIKYSNREDA
jgi:hypothetical protein